MRGLRCGASTRWAGVLIVVIASGGVVAGCLEPSPDVSGGYRHFPYPPEEEFFGVDNDAARTVRVQGDPVWIGDWATELNATFHATTASSEKRFGLLVKTQDSDDATFAGSGPEFNGTLRSASPNMTYLFFAKTKQPFVEVSTVNLSLIKEQTWPLQTRNATSNLTGPGRTAEELSANDLAIDAAWAGVGTITLADGRGTERFQLSTGASDWALVDLPGTWTFSCTGTCVGVLRTAVTSWPGWT